MHEQPTPTHTKKTRQKTEPNTLCSIWEQQSAKERKRVHTVKMRKREIASCITFTVITAIHIYLGATQKRFTFALKYTITSIDDEASR